MDGCLQCFSAGYRITDLLLWRPETIHSWFCLRDMSDGWRKGFKLAVLCLYYKCSHDCMSIRRSAIPQHIYKNQIKKELDWKDFSSTFSCTHPAAFLTSRKNIILVGLSFQHRCVLNSVAWETTSETRGSSNKHEVEKSQCTGHTCRMYCCPL